MRIFRFLILAAFLVVSPGAWAAFKFDWSVSALVCTAALIGIDALTLGSATPIMIAAGASVGLHACGLSIAWTNNNVTPTGPIQYAIALDAQIKPSTPSGWRSAALGPVTDTTVASRTWSIGGNTGAAIGEKSSPTALLSQLNTPEYTNILDYEWVSQTNAIGSLQFARRIIANQQVIETSTVYSTPPCPVGYMGTMSGTCTSDDTGAHGQPWKPLDGRCDIIKQDGVFKVDPQDPDCSPEETDQIITGIGTRNLLIPGTSESSVAVEGSAPSGVGETAGGSVIVNGFDSGTGKTKKVVTYVTLEGNIGGVSQVEVEGNQTQGSAAGNSGGTGGGSGSGNGSGGSGSSGWPSDYARSGEAATAAQIIHTDLTATTNSADPTSKTEDELKSVWFKTSGNGPFGSLLSWTLPPHQSECPKIDFPKTEYTPIITMDSHCSLFSTVAPMITLVFNLLYSLSAMSVVLRA